MNNTLRGPINSKKLKQLLGDYAGNVITYNYTTGTWNKNTLMGHKIIAQDADTQYALEMKDAIDNHPLMAGRKLVATIATVIDGRQFPGIRSTTIRPIPTTQGTCIAGNIITYDEDKNLIYGPGDEWLCIYRMPYSWDAAIYAAGRFTRCVADQMEYQRALLKMHIR